MSDKTTKLPKASELIDTDEVTKYDNEVTTLIESYTSKSSEVIKDSEKCEDTFLEIGSKLVEIEKTIKREIDNKRTARTYFSAFKKRVAKQVNRNESNVEKVVKVAKFCETPSYKNNKDKLPRSWGTLYLVCGLDDAKITKLMSDSEVIHSITRSDLAKKIDFIKNPEKKEEYKVTITVKSGHKPTYDELAKLKKYLKNSFKDWEIYLPEPKEDNTSEELK
jgi:hypothetical protein